MQSKMCTMQFSSRPPDLHFSIQTFFSDMEWISIMKITRSWNRLIFIMGTAILVHDCIMYIMGTPIVVRQQSLIETAPGTHYFFHIPLQYSYRIQCAKFSIDSFGCPRMTANLYKCIWCRSRKVLGPHEYHHVTVTSIGRKFVTRGMTH